MLGYEVDEIGSDFEAWKSHLHPEELEGGLLPRLMGGFRPGRLGWQKTAHLPRQRTTHLPDAPKQVFVYPLCHKDFLPKVSRYVCG